jgi:hypothetical protein
VPELTLSIPTTSVAGVTVDDKPLRRAPNRAGFESGTYLPQDQNLLVAFDTAQRKHVINVSK